MRWVDKLSCGYIPGSPVEGNVVHCRMKIPDLYRGQPDDLSSWIVPFHEVLPEMGKSTWSIGVDGQEPRKQSTLPRRDGKGRGGKRMVG